MKIYYDNADISGLSRTGPHTFARRIAEGLAYRGHTPADPSDYDVALVFIEKTRHLNLSKPYLHRLDGMWMKPSQYKAGMNDNIKSTMENSQMIVFQSEFDKQMLSKHLISPIKSVVIRNGISQQESSPDLEVSTDLLALRSKFDKIFVSSANWHPQKRLRDNIEIFKKIRESQYPNSCLIVLGSSPDCQVSDRGIFYAGSWTHEQCLQMFKIADWMIHCAYLDHCPNTCIESISQGCPVICTSEGGTKELIGIENGIVILDAQPFEFNLNDYDNPPRVETNRLGKLPENFRANPKSVDMEKVIADYEKCLQECIDNYVPGFRNQIVPELEKSTVSEKSVPVPVRPVQSRIPSNSQVQETTTPPVLHCMQSKSS